MTSKLIHLILPFLLVSPLMAESITQESWRKAPSLVISKAPPESGLWRVFRIKGLIQCGVLCGQDDHCNSFQYSLLTSMCSGFHVFRAPGVTDGSVVSYVRNVFCSEEGGYKMHRTSTGTPMCFKDFNERLTWDQAREQCHGDGAELLITDSQDKADYIFQYVKKNTHARSYATWLGLVKETHDKKVVYRWLNNSTNIPWGYREPDVWDNQECGEMDSDGVSDMQCYKHRLYICEKK